MVTYLCGRRVENDLVYTPGRYSRLQLPRKEQKIEILCLCCTGHATALLAQEKSRNNKPLRMEVMNILTASALFVPIGSVCEEH